MGRELCLFIAVDASRIPQRQRAGFVTLAVRRAAPFADPEYDVLWLGDHAAVWYWSRGRARALLAAQPGATPRVRAEAMFRGDVPGHDEVELLGLGDADESGTFDAGIEARVWRDGRLMASRWWPRLPDAAAWAAFARGAGLDPRLDRPEPRPAPLRPQPLSGASARRVTLGADMREWRAHAPLVAMVAGTAVAAALVWQLAGLARANWEVRRVQQRIARVSDRLEPIIAARERADRAQGEIAQLLALRAPSSQTRLLAEIKRITPGSWQLQMWHQPSPDILEVTLKAASPDVPAIVSAWEKSALLQDVTPATSARPDELKLQARLTPWAEQSP